MQQPNPNLVTIPVGTLVGSLRNMIERNSRMERFLISGEISGLSRYANGNTYFLLKDEKAAISCVMWGSIARKLDVQLEDGMGVLVYGKVEIYQQQGKLQLSVRELYLNGEGILYAKYEQLKKRLEQEGYFDISHKKPRPEVIGTIGIVTGAGTAALTDMMRTIRTRWPMLEVELFPALVQGEKAPAQICAALEKADAAGKDAIILARGGGSFEDLFCFNDESIVKTLYHMKTYTVTGIGHERDHTLAEFTADHGSLTPTAAATWVTPDQRDVRERVWQLDASIKDSIRRLFDQSAARLVNIQTASALSHPLDYIQSRKNRLDLASSRLEKQLSALTYRFENELSSSQRRISDSISNYLSLQQRRIDSLRQSVYLNSPRAQTARSQARIEALQNSIIHSAQARLSQAKLEFRNAESLLQALSWQKTLERGFSIVTIGGHPVKNARSLARGESVELTFAQGSASAEITDIYGGAYRAAADQKKGKS